MRRRSASSPNEDSTSSGLIGAVLFEQNDDWQGQHRYMQVEAFGLIVDSTDRPASQPYQHSRLTDVVDFGWHPNFYTSLTDVTCAQAERNSRSPAMIVLETATTCRKPSNSEPMSSSGTLR